ncbi:MAG: DUF554 domain-containing protein [Sphaerochaetaceae bacterium]|jgi:uncharacterized membrane protein YqgA involved in biofilm formation|nr:DUF554 domain-containing protein [Sphaerochaetaceae bacterium]MDD3163713.1 DUF554 domain-containing protein [Sphaerochaetaceae bacterium]MDD4007079.1 DUF554 domain-containing protein [Sphaerochaetaceae bacterium]MDD4396339.1 DUF554 domain-containing protein [Sphaerochaetaceae bacterium]
MIATYINCIAVVLGALIGLLLKKHISEKFKEVVFASSGCVTLVLGMGMALKSSNALVMILALVIGGGIGYLIRIEDGILKLGEKIEGLTRKKGETTEGSTFAQGFMSASILFCSGAMTVVGSIQAGTAGQYQTLLVKSIMDGCMAIVFGAAYGIGVAFSALFVLVYQGFFTLAGGWLQPLLGDAGIGELAATGGVLLLMIGFGLLDLKKFKTANFLPALVLAPVLLSLVSQIPFLN